MRRTLTLSRAGASLAAAVLLLTACSGDGEEDAAAPTTTESTTAAETTAPEETEDAPQAGSEFCTQATELNAELDAAFTDSTDPAAIEESLAQAAEGFRAIDPPSELDADWTALGDGLEELGAAYAELDETDPASLTAFQERATQLQAELTSASANVEGYLTEQCGIDTEESAAPSS